MEATSPLQLQYIAQVVSLSLLLEAGTETVCCDFGVAVCIEKLCCYFLQSSSSNNKCEKYKVFSLKAQPLFQSTRQLAQYSNVDSIDLIECSGSVVQVY